MALTAVAIDGDGESILVADGQAAAVIAPAGGYFAAPLPSFLAMGNGDWEPYDGPTPDIPTEVATALAELARDLASSQSGDDMTPEQRARILALLGIEERADLNPKPGDNNLRNYWVYGKGRVKWNTFTELRRHLLEHVGPERADRIAAEWFHLRYGFWPGDDRNRVRQGKTPRGERVGPG